MRGRMTAEPALLRLKTTVVMLPLAKLPWRTTILRTLLILCFFNAAFALAGEETTAWRELFNAKDLAGWKAVGSAVWKVEEGAIVGGQDGDPKRSGLLATVERFRDFELELEFMIDEHGKYNSGVYLRNDPDTARRTGYQVNIGRGAAGEFCAGVFTDDWLSKGDEKDAIRKKLAWNKLYIRAQGARITVKLNDVQVADVTDPEPTEKRLQRGVIGFQTYGAEGHSGWVKFRAIRIREIE